MSSQTQDCFTSILFLLPIIFLVILFSPRAEFTHFNNSVTLCRSCSRMNKNSLTRSHQENTIVIAASAKCLNGNSERMHSKATAIKDDKNSSDAARVTPQSLQYLTRSKKLCNSIITLNCCYRPGKNNRRKFYNRIVFMYAVTNIRVFTLTIL